MKLEPREIAPALAELYATWEAQLPPGKFAYDYSFTHFFEWLLNTTPQPITKDP